MLTVYCIEQNSERLPSASDPADPYTKFMKSTLSLQHDFSLRSFNTFGIDANASTYLEVTSSDELFQVFDHPELMSQPKLVIGGGSNLLLTDHFSGLVLRMAIKGMNVEREDANTVYVRAAAGEKWHDLVSWTLEQGYGGLENLSWIPGTVGAAPVQNIGAYGSELKDCFHSLKAFDFRDGKVVELNKSDCQFAYRHSIFKTEFKDRFVILDVCFALPKAWKPNVTYAEMDKELAVRKMVNPTAADISRVIIDIRKRKLPDPSVTGNAGSFFKNPTVKAEILLELKKDYPAMPSYEQPDGTYRLAAGWLIDQCGWKGKHYGNAGVCETQALVLVNRGNASGKEIAELSEAIKKDVFDKFAIRLEPEPVFV